MGTTIVVAILGAASGILAGILAYIKFFAERRDKKKSEALEVLLDKKLFPLIEKQNEVIERLDKIESHDTKQDKEIRQIRLDTLRTQLYIKMEHNPHNHDTIFKIADEYFCRYRGDWVATVDFQTWADREKVKIPEPILKAIAESHSK